MRRRVVPAVAIAIVLASMAMRWSDSPAGVFAPYSIDYHTVSSGGSVLRNSCFGLAGTAGQAAPGYSSTISGVPAYSVNAGFWPSDYQFGVAQLTVALHVFANGFDN